MAQTPIQSRMSETRGGQTGVGRRGRKQEEEEEEERGAASTHHASASSTIVDARINYKNISRTNKKSLSIYLNKVTVNSRDL